MPHMHFVLYLNGETKESEQAKEIEWTIQLCWMVLGLKKLRQIAFIVLIILKAKFARK